MKGKGKCNSDGYRNLKLILKSIHDGFFIEYRFLPDRRFRFDFAYPEKRLAIEYEGGIFSYGRHIQGRGYERDCEKYNLAQLAGWRVLRYTTITVQEKPQRIIEEVSRGLNV